MEFNDGHIEQPNRIVWDLDPGPAVTWKQVVKAAGLVRAVLKTLGLTSWVKTTGGRGLHVVVPIKPAREVAECLEFSRGVSDAIVENRSAALYDDICQARTRAEDPDRLLAEQPHEHIDLRLFAARTDGATVSMPLDWSELTASPERWTLLTAVRRLKRLGIDPWAKYWTCRQEVSDASLAAVQAL